MRRGFTLLELLVVVAIIAILAALLAVWIVGVKDNAGYRVTKALISALDAGCSDYRVDNGRYPPLTYAGSQNLHFYLGGGAQRQYISFRRNWLAPAATSTMPNPPSHVYDAWDRIIDYQNAGQTISIVSEGRLTGDPSDDVTNWQQD